MRLGVYFSLSILKSVLLVTFLFFSLVALIELVEIGNSASSELLKNPPQVLGKSALTSISWALDLLPISFLVGSILAILELQNGRTLIIAKTSGVSIWGIARWPIFTFALLGFFVTYVAEPLVLSGSQTLERIKQAPSNSSFIGTGGARWFMEEFETGKYYVYANSVSEDGLKLSGVRSYEYSYQTGQSRRLSAQSARFEQDSWVFENGNIVSSDGLKAKFGELVMPSNSSMDGLRLQLGSVAKMSVFELQSFIGSGAEASRNSNSALMRLRQMEVRPALLVGALLIAFAFTTGYQRHGTSGTQVLYGIVLGFVLYVVTKLLYRAGETGSMDASLAAWGPAIVTIVIGTSVLLWKEDG